MNWLRRDRGCHGITRLVILMFSCLSASSQDASRADGNTITLQILPRSVSLLSREPFGALVLIKNHGSRTWEYPLANGDQLEIRQDGEREWTEVQAISKTARTLVIQTGCSVFLSFEAMLDKPGKIGCTAEVRAKLGGVYSAAVKVTNIDSTSSSDLLREEFDRIRVSVNPLVSCDKSACSSIVMEHEEFLKKQNGSTQAEIVRLSLAKHLICCRNGCRNIVHAQKLLTLIAEDLSTHVRADAFYFLAMLSAKVSNTERTRHFLLKARSLRECPFYNHIMSDIEAWEPR